MSQSAFQTWFQAHKGGRVTSNAMFATCEIRVHLNGSYHQGSEFEINNHT